MSPAFRRTALSLIAACAFLCAMPAAAEMYSPLDAEILTKGFPLLDQEMSLECTLYSHFQLSEASLKIELSEGIQLVKGQLNWQGSMAAGQTMRFELVVKPTTPGNKTITATAFSRVDETKAYSDIAQLFFHADVDAAVRGHVFDTVPTISGAACLETGEVSSAPKLEDYLKLPMQMPSEPEPCTSAPGQSRVQDSGPSPDGTVTVSGRWCYYDRDDTYRPMEWMYLELRRGSDDAVLTSTWLTDNNGYYTFPAVANPGAAGFRVRAWCYHDNTNSCDGKALRVVDCGAGRDDGGNVYTICYSVQTGIRTSGDGTYDMGTWHVSNGDAYEPAYWIMMDLNKGFWWPYWWNDHTTMNGGVTVEWSPTSTHGDHNHRTDDGGNIHLKAASPNVCDVVLHEYGHEVQWDGYGQ